MPFPSEAQKHGCTWMHMDGHGWMDMDGWTWMHMDAHGCTWMDGHEWMDMDGHGCTWMDMDGHGWMDMDGWPRRYMLTPRHPQPKCAALRIAVAMDFQQLTLLFHTRTCHLVCTQVLQGSLTPPAPQDLTLGVHRQYMLNPRLQYLAVILDFCKKSLLKKSCRNTV